MKNINKGNKKLLKEKKIYSSAYELFTTKGIFETTIDDIVRKAGIAKGTFYLYFKNKYDLIDQIVLKKSFSVLEEALSKTAEQKFDDITESIIFFIDYIIEYFKKNKKLLKVIHKNLSWGIFRKALIVPEDYSELGKVQELFVRIMKEKHLSQREFETNIFMIIELTSSVCYSSIVLGEPYSIDEIKPELLKMIRKMIQ